MRCTQYYPVIMTSDVAGTCQFYRDHFGFKTIFDSDWYVHLQSMEDETVNLAVLQGNHETVPEVARSQVSGLILNFEVEDVDEKFIEDFDEPEEPEESTESEESDEEDGSLLSQIELTMKRLREENKE